MNAVALVGVTASGKSAAALALAMRRGDTELVSVDSMCVYRGMDIGTSKPDAAARAAVPHHLLDLVEPDQDFAVTDFQVAARQALEDIAGRGRHAVLVGGTGLYLRAVVDHLEIPGRFPDVAAGLEAELEDGRTQPADLHARLEALDPVAAARMEPTNRRRIVRALEVTLGAGRPFSTFGPGLETYPADGLTQIGIRLGPDEVDRRIEGRFAAMVEAGLLEEVRALVTLSRGPVAHGPPGPRVQGAPGPRRGRCSPPDLPGGGGPPHPPVRPPPSRLVPPGPPHHLGRGRPRGGGTGGANPRHAWLMDVACENGAVHATKHEGAGNDFLVVLDPDDSLRFTVAQVRLLADRRRGIGADGIIRVGPGRDGADLSMQLHNADGGEAEMSGNGIRCLAQASVDAGLVRPPRFTVATAGRTAHRCL